ncbi:MAG: DUF882 domain-containing protein [Methylocella sp.]
MARRFISGKPARFAAACFAAALCCLFAASSTETAAANGDTRSLDLYHSHTGESIHATFRVNGAYDPAVLEKLNYFLRDWRNNDVTHMDPRLFDVVWEVYRTAGAAQPVEVVSAYRSPETNAMLRARSKAVAEHSQHILGKAMDSRVTGLSMEQIREIGMRLQRGGVGYYQRENFVHLDVGNVRHWPRMSYDQIARLFPDGKTVHLAADGRPQPHYQEALAEISARGGVASDVPMQAQGGNLFGWLFGNHEQEREEEAVAAREAAPGRGAQVASLSPAAPPQARMTAAERRAAAPAAASIDAANAPDSAPAANANKTQVAALAPQQNASAATATAPTAAHHEAAAAADAAGEAGRSPAKDKAGKMVVAGLAPLPPARPADLVAFADVPTPPIRPEGLVHLASVAPHGAEASGATASAAVKTDAPKTNAPKTDAAKIDAAKVELAKTELAKSEPAKIETARIETAKLESAKLDLAGRLARAASLPVVITRGPRDQQGLPASALGYAATSAPAPRPRATTPGAAENDAAPEIVSARLDRSNYSELTSATPTAEEPPASVLGQAFTGLRQAAHIIPDALSATSAGYKIAFSAAAGLLDCAHFTKSAANASAASANGVSISEASPVKPN